MLLSDQCWTVSAMSTYQPSSVLCRIFWTIVFSEMNSTRLFPWSSVSTNQPSSTNRVVPLNWQDVLTPLWQIRSPPLKFTNLDGTQ